MRCFMVEDLADDLLDAPDYALQGLRVLGVAGDVGKAECRGVNTEVFADREGSALGLGLFGSRIRGETDVQRVQIVVAQLVSQSGRLP